MPTTKAVASTAVVEYTPIKELLSASWLRVKLVWVKLLLLSLMIYAVAFIGMVVLTMVVIGGSVMSGLSNTESLQAGIISALTTMAPIAIVLVVAYVLVMMFVSVVAGAAMLLVVAKAEEKPTLGSVVSKGMTLFLPMLLTSLLVSFLVIGGMFLFVIPGIIIAIYMMFSTYEVVLNDQKYLQAMKNSATMIKQHFGAIFVRFLAIIGLSIGIGLINGVLHGIFKDSAAMAGLISLVYTVAEIALSWLIVCFMYLIYKEVREKTDFKQTASLTWMWIVSIIGWIIGVFMLMAMGVAIAAFIKSGLIKDALKQGADQSRNEIQLDDQAVELDADTLIDQYGSELSPEEQQLMRDIINGQASE